MNLIYNLAIFLYKAGIYLASFFNQKAEKFVNGRKNLYRNLEKVFPVSKKVIWIHCASLGEFEQGRPLIEDIKKKYPGYFVLLTFFSPSGYEVRKNYTLADYVCYLPLDSPGNARKFVRIIQPEKVFFVKYEYWRNYLHQLQKHHIPVYLISAIFIQNQVFFKWYGGYFRKILNYFNQIFTQDESSRKLLENVYQKKITISGDTRFDRVYEIKNSVKPYPLVEKFKGSKRVLIAGSSWEPDEKLIARFYHEKTYDFKLIIAPHEVHDANIHRIKQLFGSTSCMLFSSMDEQSLAQADVLIIDTIGHLSSLYPYGDIAFIGGGFGKGIHNTLEAVTFGLPVFFGPNHQKFREALELIEKGAGFPVNDYEEFKMKIKNLLDNDERLESTGIIAEDYVKANVGATSLILKETFLP